MGLFLYETKIPSHKRFPRVNNKVNDSSTREYEEYKQPEAAGESDDLLADKKLVFDEKLADSRPLEKWIVNQSAAVISLDCPPINPEETADRNWSCR